MRTGYGCKCSRVFERYADYAKHRLTCEYLAPYEREPIVAPVLPIRPVKVSKPDKAAEGSDK